MKSSQVKSRASARRARRGQQAPRPARASNRLVAAARGFAAKIAGFVIGDQGAADLAGRWRQEIDAQERRVLQWFAPAKQAAFKAHAAIRRQESQALAPYREARQVLNRKLAAWHRDRIARSTQCPAARDGENTLRVEGVSFRENWCVEVTDKMAFVGAIAARADLLNLIEPRLSALRHLAHAHQGALQIPGVRVWREPLVTARPGVRSQRE